MKIQISLSRIENGKELTMDIGIECEEVDQIVQISREVISVLPIDLTKGESNEDPQEGQ